MLICLNYKNERMLDLLIDVIYLYYSYCNVFMIKLEVIELVNIFVCLMIFLIKFLCFNSYLNYYDII